MRVAAVADIHFTRTTGRELSSIFTDASRQADVLVLCGDLTDYGLPEEAQMLAAELKTSLNIPVLGVLGNHDYESGYPEVVKRILTDAGVHILDGDACDIDGVGFAGVKGFAGGFGPAVLAPWGEKMIKDFVQEAVSEALKLEAALARLKSARRMAVLHYAPVEATVAGEPREIYPFLGCSRLEETLNRYAVDVVVHGHAHRGVAEGATSKGIPVYNVSLPLMRRQRPEGPPFRLIDL
ncbi:MAG: metallophosphoesterase [Acidobacteria bacterium]|nr:metallophosphoesterase [Acidobacteriota bacterium]